MVLIKKYIDLSLLKNQILVAQDWVIYKERIIISEDLRHKIESYVSTYYDGVITRTELYDYTFEAISLEYKSNKN